MEKNIEQQVLDFGECKSVAEKHTTRKMKENMRVTVTTHMNGSYELICTNGTQRGKYLYFAPEELAMGVAIHVADGILTEMDKGDISSLICDHLKMAKRYESSVRKLESALDGMRKKRSDAVKECAKLKKQLENYVKKYGTL